MAWWAKRYDVRPEGREVTSRDIDFWGSREDLKLLASRLGRPAIFPSLVELIHTVPGLDTNEPEQASVLEEFAGRQLYVLSPVSLVLSKLHALRHFDQSDRQDKEHLLVCLEASGRYLKELLAAGHVKVVLREVERLISVQAMKPAQRLERTHHFKLLSAIPIEAFRQAAKNAALPMIERQRLRNFLAKRWPGVSRHKSSAN